MPPDDIRKAEMHLLAMEMAKMMSATITAEIAASERRMGDRLDAARGEILHKIGDIESEQKEMGKAMSRVETRLDEGDKKFDALELRIAQLETRERLSAIGVAKLIGAMGAGALATKAWLGL